MGRAEGTARTMATQTIETETRRTSGKSSRLPRILLIVTAVLAVLALAALAWALFGGRLMGSAMQLEPGKPKFVTESELRDYGNEHGPIYWAGPMTDVHYELTVTMAGAVFVRYVPKDETVGTQTEVLTVATYPEQHGYTRLEEAAAEEGVGSQITTTNALVVVNPTSPLSTYFSFPEAAFQVEVFSPTEGESEQQVLAGSIALIGADK